DRAAPVSGEPAAGSWAGRDGREVTRPLCSSGETGSLPGRQATSGWPPAMQLASAADAEVRRPPARRTATAITIRAPATRVVAVTLSPRNPHPSATATSGLTYA